MNKSNTKKKSIKALVIFYCQVRPQLNVRYLARGSLYLCASLQRENQESKSVTLSYNWINSTLTAMWLLVKTRRLALPKVSYKFALFPPSFPSYPDEWIVVCQEKSSHNIVSTCCGLFSQVSEHKEIEFFAETARILLFEISHRVCYRRLLILSYLFKKSSQNFRRQEPPLLLPPYRLFLTGLTWCSN